MSQSNMKAALVQAFIDGGFGLETAYENKKFTPPESDPYVRLFFLPAQPSAASIGTNGSDRHTGVFKIVLSYPEDTGDGAASAMADSIADVFEAGTQLTYSGQEVLIRSCGRGGGRVEKPWYTLTITVYWYATTYRN